MSVWAMRIQRSFSWLPGRWPLADTFAVSPEVTAELLWWRVQFLGNQWVWVTQVLEPTLSHGRNLVSGNPAYVVWVWLSGDKRKHISLDISFHPFQFWTYFLQFDHFEPYSSHGKVPTSTFQLLRQWLRSVQEVMLGRLGSRVKRPSVAANLPADSTQQSQPRATATCSDQLAAERGAMPKIKGNYGKGPLR
jgi:hypothetical protein